MNAAPDTASAAIGELVTLMSPFYGSGEVVIQGPTWDAIVDGLRGIQRMSVAAERELGAWRLLEAARFSRGTLETVATGVAGELVLDPDGKVLRPDFGGRA